MTPGPRARPALLVGLLLFGLLARVGAADAAPTRRATNVAAVTVSFGDGRVVHRTISFSGTISGLDALRQAGFTVDVYGFSGIGGAVCRIDGVGRPADANCLSGGAEYWAYYRNGAYSRAGASTTQVHDHDQEGWAWGKGTAAPPTTAFPAPTTQPPATPPPTAAPATAPPATRPPATPPPATQAPVTSPGPGPTTAPPPTTPGVTTVTTLGPTTTAAPSPSSSSSSSTSVAPSTSRGDPSTTTAADQAQAAGSVTPVAGTDDGGPGGARWSMVAFGLVLAAFAALIVRARLRRSG